MTLRASLKYFWVHLKPPLDAGGLQKSSLEMIGDQGVQFFHGYSAYPAISPAWRDQAAARRLIRGTL
jgi:hypothetical protein